MSDIDIFISRLKEKARQAEVVHHEVSAPSPAVYARTRRPLLPEVEAALERLGVKGLYSHQALGIDLVRDSRNTVVMTPAASGKSLVYNVPVIESIIADPGAKALYLFPLKGLEQDQLRAFRALTGAVDPALLPPLAPAAEAPRKRRPAGAAEPSYAEIYDGDTPEPQRARIRESPPPVLLTNPDMLHLSINAYHQKWERFLRGLKYVIVDEIHAYRGVFGSHVAHVLRRLRRIAALYGASPVFIACSATIANPGELASMLTGLDFEVVASSGAPRGKGNFVFINPDVGMSPYTVATRLFSEAVKAGLKTIAFTKARRVTELMHRWVIESAPELKGSISSYRAGFLPEERREIERRLFSGELTGVISTSALELGVDVGGLDVCILVGYPGTISSTLQRSGRVGRSGRDSAVLLVALEDALDQHFMRHPDDFFRRRSEAAMLDASNRTIAKGHLACAAAESYLKAADTVYDTAALRPLLDELESESKLRYWAKGPVWFPRTRFPHRNVSIREAGRPYLIVDEGGRVIGTSNASRAVFELHPGAVYVHRGELYAVVELDMGAKRVVCRQAGAIGYYTSPITEEETEIIRVESVSPALGTVAVNYGELQVVETVVGYRRKDIFTRKQLDEHPLDLPPVEFRTMGLWMTVPEDLVEEVRDKGFDPAGSLHALEHAAIAALPLFALCDRMDLGGVSYYPFNPDLEEAAVFIYDAHEGGVGLTRRGLECLGDWFAATLAIMEECGCEVSCPSCTQDPKCGNNNEPLDKRGASLILRRWLGKAVV